MDGIEYKLLPHQTQLIRSIHKYPDITFFFDVAGFGSGKSFADVALLLAILHWYQGEWLTFGIGGATIKHLKETVIADFLRTLDRVRMPYKHNSQSGTIKVGTIEFVYFSLTAPENIFGFNLCFARGTLIDTIDGRKAIETLKPGDQVLTSEGYRPLTELVTNEGRVIDTRWAQTTLNHPVYLPHRNAYVPLWKIRQQDRLAVMSDVRSSICGTLYSTMERLGALGKEQLESSIMRLRKLLIQSCIDTSGRKKLALSQRDTLFITKMVTRLTTILATSSLWKKDATTVSRILGTQLRSFYREALKPGREQSSNVVGSSCLNRLALVRSAVKNMRGLVDRNESVPPVPSSESSSDPGHGTPVEETLLLNDASIAEKNLLTSQPPTLDAFALFHMPSVSDTTVHNLLLPEPHNYYANGVLVHNCGALLDELDEDPEAPRVKVAVTAVQERCRVTLPATATQPISRSPFITCTTTAQGLRGTYMLTEYYKSHNIPFVMVRGRTRDNFHLDPKQLENLYKLYTEDEARAYLDGEFINLTTGRVYAEFDASKHVYQPFPISPTERLYVGQDFNPGFNMCVIGVLRGNHLYIVDEAHWQVVGDAPRQLRLKYPENPITLIPDVAGKELMHAYWEEFENHGIECIWNNVNPSVSERILALNKMCRTGLFHIFAGTTKTELSLKMRGFDDSGKPMKQHGPEALDHPADALEYMVWHVIHTHHGFEQILNLLSQRSYGHGREEVA